MLTQCGSELMGGGDKVNDVKVQGQAIFPKAPAQFLELQ